MHTCDLSFLVCPSVLSVCPGASGRASLCGDITPQWLESDAGFSSTMLSMLGRGLGDNLHYWPHSVCVCVLTED